MNFDSCLEPIDKDDRVGMCHVCNEELHCIDEILKHDNELYCGYDCFKSDQCITKSRLNEDTYCGFCGEPLYKDDIVISDLFGSVFCDKCCVLGAYDIEEVYGYDIPISFKGAGDNGAY